MPNPKGLNPQAASAALDRTLAALKNVVSVEVSNKIREGFSKELNVDASKNVEVNVESGSEEDDKEPAEPEEPEKPPPKPPPQPSRPQPQPHSRSTRPVSRKK